MKKWIVISIITLGLLAMEYFFHNALSLHFAFKFMVFFFAFQTFVLSHIDRWVDREWSVQIALVKVVIRLLSSLVFILVLMYSQLDHFNLVVQFIILYLIYMIFDIVTALTNLRQN